MKKNFFALTLAILISSCANPQSYETDLGVGGWEILIRNGYILLKQWK